jgi:putative redox protein
MSLHATARSISGTLRQEVVIDGLHRVTTDEPERLGGEGSGPAPHELLPAAVASCVGTTLLMYARVKSWDLGSVSVAVDFDNDSTPRRCDVVVELGCELHGDQLRRLEKVARTCPVRRSLEPGVEFTETISCRNRPSRPAKPHRPAA